MNTADTTTDVEDRPYDRVKKTVSTEEVQVLERASRLSREYLAAMAGVNVRTWEKWVYGEARCPWATFQWLKVILGQHPYYRATTGEERRRAKLKAGRERRKDLKVRRERMRERRAVDPSIGRGGGTEDTDGGEDEEE